MPWILGGAALAGDLLGGFFGSDSQERANRQNIKLAREGWAREERLSNTAVQRRADDIARAGGNRALAFTNGQSASSPTGGTPSVDPTFKPEWTKGSLGTAAMVGAQLDQVKAQTQNATADTRLKNANARLVENFGEAGTAADVENKQRQSQLYRAQIQKAEADARISETTADLLADKMGAAIQLLESQAKLGKLNADSSEAIAKTLGVAGKDVGPVARLFLDLAKLLISGQGK